MPNAIFYSNYSVTLDEANPSIVWGGSPYLISGLYANTTPPNLYRSLLHFDISSLSSDIQIQSCILNIYVTTVASSTVQDLFTPYLVSSPWSQATTWATQPLINYSIKGTSTPISNVGPINFDVTPIVKYWINSASNNGLIINSTESIPLSTKTFFSSNYTSNLSQRPFLNIQYIDSYPVTVFRRRFETTSNNLATSTTPQASSPIDVSQIFDYTIFIQNTGTNLINLTLQISPDGINFATEAQNSISTGELIPIVSRYLTNYIRFVYNSVGGVGSFKYWIIKQS
ncbi:DNRLRE domain-containing protein [Clostridium drakei]|uniref:DNRLRE domain-containing protein n=1 Tax=Clostridium drakei TaxID=332101 RepID=A0A2U8DKQ6_9CLOT|nr:DNRLRE domain-containing protein [Clostridium drakei]AWI03306.1 hypothetical protein B9W14_01940 [Clostridium drakei]